MTVDTPFGPSVPHRDLVLCFLASITSRQSKYFGSKVKQLEAIGYSDKQRG